MNDGDHRGDVRIGSGLPAELAVPMAFFCSKTSECGCDCSSRHRREVRGADEATLFKRYQLDLSLEHLSITHALPQRPLLRALMQPFLALVWAAPISFERPCSYKTTLSAPGHRWILRTLQLTAIPGISYVFGTCPTIVFCLVTCPPYRPPALHLTWNRC